MKKLLISAFCLLIFCAGCGRSFAFADPDSVKEIVVWTHESERRLTEDEILKVIGLYNESVYGGKAMGEGGTPDFGLKIVLTDDSKINVNDFYGKVEVITGKGNFYLENEGLYAFIKDL